MTFGQTLPGLKVLDLSTNIAGPFAAMILGDMGAEVIKIERPPHGDDTRALPPRWEGEATVFLSVNRNKRSLLLDIRSLEGKAALLRRKIRVQRSLKALAEQQNEHAAYKRYAGIHSPEN